jgi:hypothetical protein
VIPELALAAEAAQLDHGEREFEAILLRLLHDRQIEIEAGLVLRRCRGNQPSVIPDRDKYTNIRVRGTRWLAMIET